MCQNFFFLRVSWLIGKDSDAGRDWGQKKKGTAEDEMDGWRHWLNGRESEWTPGVGDGQGDLGCCDSRGHGESDTTKRLNWTELNTSWEVFFSLQAWNCLFQRRKSLKEVLSAHETEAVTTVSKAASFSPILQQHFCIDSTLRPPLVARWLQRL